MPRNFPGATQAQLETWLAAANEELAMGKSLNSAGAGDVTSAFATQQGITARIRMLLYDLYQLDPTNYPLTMLQRTRAVARLRDRPITGASDS